MLKKKWEDQNIDARVDKLLEKIKTNSIDDLPYELNKIDKSISEIMRHAEKKCCALSSSHLLHWSPTLKTSLDNLRQCRLTRTKLQYIQPNQTVKEAITKYNEACAAYDLALAEYQSVKRNHVELRQTYLQELAQDLALQNNTDQASELNRLRHIENQRGTHTKFRYVLKPQSREGVHSILIPASTTYADATTDHTNVEEKWKAITPHNGTFTWSKWGK